MPKSLYAVFRHSTGANVLRAGTYELTNNKKTPKNNIADLISYLDLNACLSSAVTDNSVKLGFRVSNLFLILCSQITAPETQLPGQQKEGEDVPPSFCITDKWLEDASRNWNLWMLVNSWFTLPEKFSVLPGCRQNWRWSYSPSIPLKLDHWKGRIVVGAKVPSESGCWVLCWYHIDCMWVYSLYDFPHRPAL